MAYNRQFKIIKDFGQLMGQYTVEDGVKKLIICGTASGASAEGAAAHSWTTAVRQVIAASPSFEHVFGTQDNAGTHYPQRLDWVAAQNRNYCNGTQIAANNAGLQMALADNGFGVCYGSAGTGFFTTDGNNWAQISGGGAIYPGNGERRRALNAVSRTATLASVRSVGVDGSTGLQVWTGSAWLGTTYASHAFTSVHFANGHFLANNNGTAGQTKLKYSTEANATSPTGWNDITVDASAQNQVNDLIYSARLGMWIAACNGGKIFTQTTAANTAPTGAWTSRASGTVDNIVGIKESSAHVVMVTSTGKVLYSTDGITWNVTAAIVGAMQNRDAIGYITVPGTLPTNGTLVWCLVRNDTTGSRIFTSTDLANWTQSPNTTTYNAMLAAPNGLIALKQDAAAAFNNLSDPRTATVEAYTGATFNGGDAIVKGLTSGALYRLGGAQGQKGGSSESNQLGTRVGTSGSGSGGAGVAAAATVFVAGTGTAGPSTSTSVAGGGGSIQFHQLAAAEGTWGVKIPGANGGPNGAGGGAGSIFGWGGANGQPGFGWGAGSNGASSFGGGAGEAVWRAELTVTPGEVVVFTGGINARESSSYSATSTNSGNIRIEVEA